jgi:hypothetical protein
MDDPLEAAVFSVLVEMLKQMKEMEENNDCYTDRPHAPGASDGQNGSVNRSSKNSD